MFPSLARAATAAAVIAACALALLGLATTSVAVLIALAVIAILVGPAVAMAVHRTHPDSAHALSVGAAGSAVTLAAGLIVAGLVALLGAVTVPVVLTLLVVGGIWAYRRGSPWLDRPGRTSTGLPARWRIRWPRRPRRTAVASPNSSPPLVQLGLPALDIGTTSMPGLCAAWQRTYWLLCDLPPASPARLVVVQLRGKLLEEFERRDPAGFGRWLHTEPRACSNPGRYLATGH